MPHEVSGTVIKGDKRGEQLGIPTANIKPSTEVIPQVGVYATEIEIKGHRYLSITNIGFRPTFEEKRETPVIETHLLDFHQNIYGVVWDRS